MTTTANARLKLSWAGEATLSGTAFLTDEEMHLLSANGEFSVDKLRFKYKKQIKESIRDGFFTGNLYVGINEVEWEWEPDCFVDGESVALSDLKDDSAIEDIVGLMLEGTEFGEKEIEVPIDIDVTVTAQNGNLAMGEVTISCSDILNIYESCNFATDGKEVIFDEELELSDKVICAVKSAIIELVGA